MVTPSAEFADDPHSDDVEVCQAHRRVFEKRHEKPPDMKHQLYKECFVIRMQSISWLTTEGRPVCLEHGLRT